MSRHVKCLMFIGWTITLLASGCTKSPNGPEQSTPTIPSLTFNGPKTSSSDPNAQSVISEVATMNAFTQQLSALRSMPGVQKGTARTWTYTSKALTVTLTATAQPDGSDQWVLVLNGTDTSGTTYNNFTVGSGTTSAGGKNGTWDLYDSTSTSPLSELSWTTTNTILNGTLKSFLGGSIVAQTVVVNNPDNSGELTLYSGTLLTFKAVWSPDGSGQWWTYGPNDAQTGTGSWT